MPRARLAAFFGGIAFDFQPSRFRCTRARARRSRSRSAAAGIDVTGQLVAQNQPPGFDYHFAINHLVARQPGIVPPAFLAAKGFDWKKGWSDAWSEYARRRSLSQTLHTLVREAGAGRPFPHLGPPAGRVRFCRQPLRVRPKAAWCIRLPQRVVHFSVKPGDVEARSGQVSIPSITLPKVGDVAGDFSFDTLGRRKTSLAALRGNYVLVDFWATLVRSACAKLDQVEPPA